MNLYLWYGTVPGTGTFTDTVKQLNKRAVRLFFHPSVLMKYKFVMKIRCSNIPLWCVIYIKNLLYLLLIKLIKLYIKWYYFITKHL